jgi:hypothetical protein
MKTKLLLLSILIFNTAYSQWSTSPYADSGLYVCPGFDPGIVTFDDGSSVVLGLLSSYIYAQKLDPAGYKVWPQPVLVFHNGSSDMVIGDNSERTWFCSDGDGGVILFWQDYRGAYYSTVGPKNSTTHLQRVDKYGDIKWGTDGITVNNIQDGYKRARITSDGSGGCVLLWTEYGFDYPDAPQRSNIKLARYNKNGTKSWCTILDSTIYSVPAPYEVIRGGKYYYVGYANFLSDYEKRIDENGDISSLRNMQVTALVGAPDGENYFSNDYSSIQYTYKVSKISSDNDTLWTTSVYYGNLNTEIGGYLYPDNKGGVYLAYIYKDSIMHFDSAGNYTFNCFKGIGNYSNYFFSDGGNGLLAANATTVVRYDNTGKMIWPDTVVYLNDNGNAYARYFGADNNGGFIIVYWSTIGGIFAQHSGRTGRLGRLTGVKNIVSQSPQSFELYQNYPNPFNGTTQIKYSVRIKSRILLSVYDILGRKVITLVDKIQEKGEYVVIVDLLEASSGIYFYRLASGIQHSIIHKMMLTK